MLAHGHRSSLGVKSDDGVVLASEPLTHIRRHFGKTHTRVNWLVALALAAAPQVVAELLVAAMSTVP